MRRILVIGCPGAGKTTFANRLSEKVGVPVIHLDAHFWLPGWRPRKTDEWRRIVSRLVEQPDWIMDGDFSGTFDLRMPCAEGLLWLDYPRRVCLGRVLARAVRNRGRSRPDLPKGCREQLSPALIRHIWKFPRASRLRIVDGIERYGGHLRRERFSSDREADAWLAAAGTG